MSGECLLKNYANVQSLKLKNVKIFIKASLKYQSSIWIKRQLDECDGTLCYSEQKSVKKVINTSRIWTTVKATIFTYKLGRETLNASETFCCYCC